MRPNHLFAQIAMALMLLVGVNLGLQRLANNSVPRQLLNRAAQSAPATDLFLGNSTMAAGLNEETFVATRPGRKALNLGLGWTSPVEHYLIHLQQDRHRGADVYYGFLDTQLTDPPDGDWSSLIGNRAMAYYVDIDTAFSFYIPDDPARASLYRLAAWVPMLVERYAIWAKVERWRRTLGELGLPRKETNRFGRAEDFALLEPESPAEFAHRCRQATADHVPLSGPVMGILRRAKEQGGRAFIIEMPMPDKHRSLYYETPVWTAYRAHLAERVQAEGGNFVPAADWIGPDGFADHLHLNAGGANTFSTLLGRYVSGR